MKKKYVNHGLNSLISIKKLWLLQYWKSVKIYIRCALDLIAREYCLLLVLCFLLGVKYLMILYYIFLDYVIMIWEEK